MVRPRALLLEFVSLLAPEVFRDCTDSSHRLSCLVGLVADVEQRESYARLAVLAPRKSLTSVHTRDGSDDGQT